MDVDEYRRKFRVLDQMLSQHGDLRDRYRALATGLRLLITAASIVGVMLALTAGEDEVTILGITWAGYKWLAALAGATFFLSIVDLVVDWPRRAWAHEDAAKRLGELKSKFRRARVEDGVVDTGGVDLDQEYDNTMVALIEVPNKRFNPLKARHRRKIAVSKLLDDHPGAPMRYLRWRVFRDGVKGVRAGRGLGVLEESPPTSGGDPDEGGSAPASHVTNGARDSDEPTSVSPPAAT